MRDTRPISWIKAAFKDFKKFPQPVRHKIENALTIAAEGKRQIVPSLGKDWDQAFLKFQLGIAPMPIELSMLPKLPDRCG